MGPDVPLSSTALAGLKIWARIQSRWGPGRVKLLVSPRIWQHMPTAVAIKNEVTVLFVFLFHEAHTQIYTYYIYIYTHIHTYDSIYIYIYSI